MMDIVKSIRNREELLEFIREKDDLFFKDKVRRKVLGCHWPWYSWKYVEITAFIQLERLINKYSEIPSSDITEAQEVPVLVEEVI